MSQQEFEYFRTHYGESMSSMFAAVSDLYAEYWHDFFHFALFKDAEETREAAYERTHRLYMEDLRLASAQKVLELGCGRGGFSHLMAATQPCEVIGIDISAAQIAYAGRKQRENLRFLCHDIMHVDRLGDSFDAAVCLDAACYLPEKDRAIEKIAAVLKPGARFLLVDWCRRDGLNSLQEEMVLHPFMRYWAVPGLETQQNYERHFAQNGLSVLKSIDLTESVRRNWEFGYDSALKAIQELSTASLRRFIWKGLKLGPRGIRIVKEQFPAALYIKVGFDTGFLRYVSILGEKSD